MKRKPKLNRPGPEAAEGDQGPRSYEEWSSLLDSRMPRAFQLALVSALLFRRPPRDEDDAAGMAEAAIMLFKGCDQQRVYTIHQMSMDRTETDSDYGSPSIHFPISPDALLRRTLPRRVYRSQRMKIYRDYVRDDIRAKRANARAAGAKAAADKEEPLPAIDDQEVVGRMGRFRSESITEKSYSGCLARFQEWYRTRRAQRARTAAKARWSAARKNG
jgi:hypothetical protein